MLFWYKLSSGCHLISAILFANMLALACCQWSALLRIKKLIWILRKTQSTHRLTELVDLALKSGVLECTLERNPEAVYVIASRCNATKQFERTIQITNTVIHRRPKHPGLAKCYGARANARIWLGQYQEAIDDLETCKQLRPGVYVEFSFALIRAYVHSQRGEVEQVRLALAEQYALDTENPGNSLGTMLVQLLEPHLNKYPAHQSVAVFFGNYEAAVGHSILDPFHMAQLHAKRFDHLVLVHPPLERYAPTSRLAVQILHQYFDQIHTEHAVLLSMAWQCAGEFTNGRCTFILNNYWSLNQAVAHARQDSSQSLSEGRHYFQLPDRMTQRATHELHRRDWEFDRPVVVVHIREHGYHNLSAQSFRNVEPQKYIPALQWLCTQGYQVVRIGDAQMTSLADDVPGLIELPLNDRYEAALDLYLLQNCRFMVSCQSGPCSFARAFGKPNLVLNAVYHYSLLPENAELFGFKDYRDATTGESLSVAEIFDRGGHLFDRSVHFDDAKITLEDMTADEILAAVQEMDAWVDNLDKPETKRQRAFRAIMKKHCANPMVQHPLWHPHADYVGYAFSECRILDTLAKSRAGFLPLPATHNEVVHATI